MNENASRPTCLVLMSTFNGEKYLREQLDSILNQKDIDVTLRVADDCSTDLTVEILKEYCFTYPNVSYTVNEKNKNFTYNFLDLLFSARDTSYDYYAFSDQDDFWLENKLISAANILKNNTNENGMLYCSNLRLVDENLIPFGFQENDKVKKVNKNNFLVANIATGCTIVVDKQFMKHCTTYYPKGIRLHDYWLLLIAAFTANYYYDMNSYILYRQHANNQIGSNKRFFSKKRFKNFLSNGVYQHKLISEFFEGYKSQLLEKDLRTVLIVKDYKKRFSYYLMLLFSRKIKRYKYNFLFKIKVLIRKY